MYNTDNKPLINKIKILSVSILLLGVVFGVIPIAAAFIILSWLIFGIFLYAWK